MTELVEIRAHPTHPTKGNSLFALTSFQPGDIIFSEQPYIASCNYPSPLSSYSPQLTNQVYHDKICAHCLKSLAEATAVFPQGFAKEGATLPLSDRFWPKAEVHQCTGCGEIYCSQGCLKKDREQHHGIYCPGMSQISATAFLDLKQLCGETRNNFALHVLKMIAVLYLDFIKAGPENTPVASWNRTFGKFATSNDIIPLPFFRGDIERTKDFHTVAFKYIMTVYTHTDVSIRQFVTFTNYLRMFNIIHLNCSQIHPSSPFDVYVSHLRKVRPVASMEKLVKTVLDMGYSSMSYTLDKIVETSGTRPGFDEKDEMIFRTLTKSTGTGLFHIHAFMNHSCDPNVKTESSNTTSAYINIVAKKKIEVGDEICVDYVGLSNSILPVKKMYRKKVLKNMYSWDCICDKCLAEAD